MTIVERIRLVIDELKTRKKILRWMRCNPLWYREIIAQEWEVKTNEDWEVLFNESLV